MHPQTNQNLFIGRKALFCFSFLFVIFAFVIVKNVNAATTTMPTALSTDTSSYVLISSSGITPSVTGFSTDILVTLSVASGTVRIASTTGLSAPIGYNSSDWTNGASEIAFEGSQTNVNYALATLAYQGTNSTSTSLEISVTPTGAAYNPDNGHYYEFVSTTLSWTAAQAAASSSTFNGLTGYLVTITSEVESDFVFSKVPSDVTAWAGASDASVEGEWRWITGPETGTQFWSGAGSGAGGVAVNGAYTDWNGTGEPNDSGGEDYMELDLNRNWNDINESGYGSGRAYVVEYGGLNGETATDQNSATVSITNRQNFPATLQSSTPTDDAIDVSVSANIVLTFDETINAQSGNITIKKSSDDSNFEVFDVTSDISGSGSTVITINPTTDLAFNTAYYVLIDATAFDGDYSNSYAGISATNTLNFITMATPTCPVISNAATYNFYPTCGVATCNSGYNLVSGSCVAIVVESNDTANSNFVPPPPPKVVVPPMFSGNTLNSQVTNVKLMVISDSEDFAGTSWVPYDESYKTSDKKLYIKFRSNEGGESDVYEIEATENNTVQKSNYEDNESKNDNVPKRLFVKNSEQTNTKTVNKLKGRIVLKVEENGEAYYFNPNDSNLYYLGRPNDAFKIMRNQGVGIANSELEKIPVGGNCPDYNQNCDNASNFNEEFANKQKGKILLQVEEHGEAWYVDSADGKRYFLGRPADAFRVMRELGLGISNNDFDNSFSTEVSIPKNCESWFDGCNTCFASDGVLGGCTRMFCTVNEEARCLEYLE